MRICAKAIAAFAAIIFSFAQLCPVLALAPRSGVGALAPSFALLAAAESLERYGLMSRKFMDYSLAIREVVNPDSKEFTALYGAAGADISSLLLAIDFTKAYFVNDMPISRQALQEQLKKWQILSPSCSYFSNKRDNGWSYYGDLSFNKMEINLIQELIALGVRKEDVILSTDHNGRLALTFRLPGDSRQRQIIFVEGEVRTMASTLNKEMAGQVDGYYQKAAHDLVRHYDKYLPAIQDWLKPEGFIVLNDHDPQGDRYSMEKYVQPLCVPRESERMRALSREISGQLPALGMQRGYGWAMSVWQKTLHGSWIDRIATEKQIAWENLPRGAILDILRAAAKERGKGAEELTTGDFVAPLKLLGGKTMFGLLTMHLDSKEPSRAKALMELKAELGILAWNLEDVKRARKIGYSIPWCDVPTRTKLLLVENLAKSAEKSVEKLIVADFDKKIATLEGITLGDILNAYGSDANRLKRLRAEIRQCRLGDEDRWENIITRARVFWADVPFATQRALLEHIATELGIPIEQWDSTTFERPTKSSQKCLVALLDSYRAPLEIADQAYHRLMNVLYV